MGKWLLIIGAVIMLAGLLLQTGWLSWFGRLPGDIRIERPNASFYFPITSMLIISAVLSILAHVVRKFF